MPRSESHRVSPLAIVGKLVLLAAALGVGLLVWLYFRQDEMVFRKPRYRDTYKSLLLPGTVPLEYRTSCGQQTGWYVPPRTPQTHSAAPARLWVMFGGNGSVALSWKKVVEFSPDAEAGFLLVDYPGYGFCEGTPTMKSIAESSDAAVVALARHLDITADELTSRPVRVMGHSLGSGMAVGFASRHPVDRIVLISPFTSMRAMADRMVTPMFGWLLRHRWDSLGKLRKILKREPQPDVIVIHGSADDTVPVEMGRAFKQELGKHVTYVEIPEGDHGTVLQGVWEYTKP